MKKYFQFFVLLFCSLYTSQNFPVSTIPDNLKNHANAVIREDINQYTISAVDKMTIKKKKTITILNKSGDDFASIYIFYDPVRKVSDIEVKVLDENGKILKTYSKKDFADFSQVQSGVIYTDNRFMALRPISTGYPYTIQYSYTTDTSDTGFIPVFTPFSNENISLEKSVLSITNKSGINLRAKISNTEFAKVEQSADATTEYTFKNVPAIKDEILSPSISKIIPQVEFALDQFTLNGKKGDMTTWDNFGKWYYNNLLTPVSAVTPEIQTVVNSLNLSGTISEKVKKLYQFMQNNTRYVNVNIGIGGWQPMFASDVQKKGYGDCKALSNYMRVLLNAAGIKSYVSLIKDNSSVETFDEKFPKLGANHMILMVPAEKDTIWLENTNQKVAFNHLFQSSANRNVLAVSENGIQIVNTPRFPANKSIETLSAKIKINEDNSIDGSSASKFSGGQYDKMLKLSYLKDQEIKEYMRELHPMLKLENLQIKDLQNNQDYAELTYNFEFKAKDYTKKLGNDIFFRIMPFYDISIFSADSERTLPFEMAFAWQDDYNLEFQIPNGYKISEMPKNVNIKSEYGDYLLEFSAQKNNLLVHRKFTINKGLYQKDKFASYLEFRKKIASGDNTKILIIKN